MSLKTFAKFALHQSLKVNRGYNELLGKNVCGQRE